MKSAATQILECSRSQPQASSLSPRSAQPDAGPVRAIIGKLVLALTWLLVAKVLVAILWEYRLYFPANFEAVFLQGREDTFVGAYRIAFYVHLLSAPPALVLAAVLLESGRRPRLLRGPIGHRELGRLQGILVLLLLVPSSLVMATRAHAGPVAGAAFAVQAVLLAFFVAAAAAAAKARELSAHRRWACRALLLLAAPLVLRVVAGVGYTFGFQSTAFYRWNAWCSWSVPLAIYEVWRFFSEKAQRPFDSGAKQPTARGTAP